MKKSLLSIITALSLFSNANCAGIPTIDSAAIAQNITDNAQQYASMIKDYALQLQQYQQMITDTLNFEKHLKALGVDMEEWSEIIGQVADTINGIEGLANGIQSIPDSFKLQLTRTQRACNFLNSNISGFSQASSELKSFKRQTNRCFMTLKNQDVINSKINELNKKLQKATNLDEIKSIQNEIQNIKNAEAFVKQEKAQETTNELISFHEAFFGEDDENQNKLKMTSYEERAKQLQNFSKQMKNAKNEKQVQAVTNSILLAMLEQNTEMQGIMVSYTRAIASQNYNNGNLDNRISETNYQNQIEKSEFPDNPYADVKKMETDEFGMPIFRLN